MVHGYVGGWEVVLDRALTVGLRARWKFAALSLAAGLLFHTSSAAAQYPEKEGPRIRRYDPGRRGAGARDSTATLIGVIHDRDQRPLSGVDVVALGVGRAAVTDRDGRYSLAGLPAGAVEIQVGDNWLERKRRTVTLAPGERHRYDLLLHGEVLIWCDQGHSEDWAIACRASPNR
jgi:hypothetical protein